MPRNPLRIPRLLDSTSRLLALLVLAAGCGSASPSPSASSPSSSSEGPLTFEAADEAVRSQCNGRLRRVVRFDSWTAAAPTMSPRGHGALPRDPDAIRDAFVAAGLSEPPSSELPSSEQDDTEPPQPPYIATDPAPSSPQAQHVVLQDDTALNGGLFVIVNVGERSSGRCPSPELRVERNHDRIRELVVSSEETRFVDEPCPEPPPGTTIPPDVMEALRERLREQGTEPPAAVEPLACGACRLTAARDYVYNGTTQAGVFVVTETSEEAGPGAGRPFIDVVPMSDHTQITGCGEAIRVGGVALQDG